MKNYDEIARSVLEKRDSILKRRAERRKKIFRIASPVAVLLLAVMIGIGFSRTDLIYDEPVKRTEIGGEGGTYPTIWNEVYAEDGEVGDEKAKVEPPYAHTTIEQGDLTLVEGTTAADSYKLSDPVSTIEIDSSPADSAGVIKLPPSTSYGDVAKGLFYINSIIGEATPAKRAYDKKDHYGVDYSAEEMETYVGIDMDSIMSQLPSDMAYVPSTHNVIMKTNGEIVYDAAHFLIKDSNGGRITVSAGRVLPPYDCVYMLKSESVSELKTDKGMVYVLAGGKDYDEEKGAFGFFFADFEYDGVYYRIEVENIYREKIIAVLFNSILGRIEID